MSDDNLEAPTHVYVLIGALAIAMAIGVVANNRILTAAMLDNPGAVDTVVASSEFRRSIEEKTRDSLAAVDLNALFSESDELQSLVSRSVSDQLVGFGSTDAFQKAVVSAMPEEPRIDDNSSKLNQLRSKLHQYESRLAGIASQVNDDESAHQVNQMQGQLIEMQQLISSLSDEVHCTLALPVASTSSFLLKERRSTELRGYDLVVTLGRVKKDVIGSVAISAPNAEHTRSDTLIVGNVTLGKSLEFQSGGQSYEGVFTYRQARIGPDFVGFEITKTARSPEECLQPESVADVQ